MHQQVYASGGAKGVGGAGGQVKFYPYKGGGGSFSFSFNMGA